MINIKKYKNMKFIILILSLIIFTFSIVTSIIITQYKNENSLNGLNNENTNYFKLNSAIQISFTDVLDVLDEYKESNIYLEFDPIPKPLEITTLFGKAIYYNYNLDNKLPILEGSNFSVDDMNSSEKQILVGKLLQSEIVEENGERYFIIDNEKYKVIGILGNEASETAYDNTFIINLKSMNYYSDSRAIWKLNLDKKYQSNALKDLQNLASNKKQSAIKVLEQENKKTNDIKDIQAFELIDSETEQVNLLEIIKNNDDFLYILQMISCFGMLNLIIVVYYWMNSSIKDIGIRKAYGATNFEITVFIIKKYIISVFISVVLGISLHFLFKTILKSMFPKFSFDIYIYNVLTITAVFVLVGLLISIIPLIKARKVQPVNIMKGRLK